MPPPWKMLNGSTNTVKSDSPNTQNKPQDIGPVNGTSHSTPFADQSDKAQYTDSAETNRSWLAHQVKVTSWPCNATEDYLRDAFSSVGEVIRAKVLPTKDGRDTTICFVSYSNDNEVDAAVRQLDNYEVNGKQIRVERNIPREVAVKQRGQRSSTCSNQLKVYGWPAELSEEELRTVFSKAGNIDSVRVLPARDGRDNTLAFVSFSSEDGVQSALSTLNGYEIEGRRLKLITDERSSSSADISQQGARTGSTPVFSTSRDTNQIKVLSCPASLSEDELKAVFASVGNVMRVKILPAREGRDITLAFVTFSSHVEADSAVEQFNGFELMGKRLRVAISESNNSVEQSHNQLSNNSQERKSNGINGRPWGSGGTTNERPCGSNAIINRQPAGAQPSSETWGDKEASSHSGDVTRSAVKDNGIFINEKEMNQNFQFKQARGPVTYIPPPPPEEESEIFRDTSHTGINFLKYENIPVEVSGKEPPKRIDSFIDAKLHPVCDENVHRAGYDVPTPIQKHALPAILGGHDVMACAQTGSGKTAAYLLPVISNLLTAGLNNENNDELAYPKALVIAPTRELAVQIFLEARKFAYGSSQRIIVIYGGVNVSHQLSKLSGGCDLLVATPGRLSDFINRGRVSLSQIQYLILDEADRMLDLGFEGVIKEIVSSSNMRPKCDRQTLMLSATFPEKIQSLAAEYLNDYIFITVGFVGGASTDIIQTIIEIPASEKRTKLEEILLESGGDRILVFVETKRSADFLASFLSQRNFPTTSISSDRSQEERECALRDFRSGKAPVLIATAVAARGLDIPDVKMVINFDLPIEIDEYVHRIGRTGRIGNQGRAIAFFDRGRDSRLARGLIKVLSKSMQDVPDWLEEIAMSAVGTKYGPGSGQFSSRDRRGKDFSQKHIKPLDTYAAGIKDLQKETTALHLKVGAQSPSTTNGNDISNDDDDMWC